MIAESVNFCFLFFLGCSLCTDMIHLYGQHELYMFCSHAVPVVQITEP